MNPSEPTNVAPQPTCAAIAAIEVGSESGWDELARALDDAVLRAGESALFGWQLTVEWRGRSARPSAVEMRWTGESLGAEDDEREDWEGAGVGTVVWDDAAVLIALDLTGDGLAPGWSTAPVTSLLRTLRALPTRANAPRERSCEWTVEGDGPGSRLEIDGCEVSAPAALVGAAGNSFAFSALVQWVAGRRPVAGLVD